MDSYCVCVCVCAVWELFKKKKRKEFFCKVLLLQQMLPASAPAGNSKSEIPKIYKHGNKRLITIFTR